MEQAQQALQRLVKFPLSLPRFAFEQAQALTQRSWCWSKTRVAAG